MKRSERLKLLRRYSGRPLAECESALEAQQGAFWPALFRLSTPAASREELLAGLDPRDPEATATRLEDLRKWFTCEPCLEAWMRIDDEELQAEYTGDPGLPMQEAELNAVLALMEACSGGDLLRCGLEMFYYWEAALPERAVTALLRCADHYDSRISELALRLFASFPDAVGAALPRFREILERAGDPRRYDLAWMLWTLAGRGHHFPELQEAYLHLLNDGDDAEQEFARDLLGGMLK